MIPPREADPYIAWRPPFPTPALGKDDSALLVIDMQYRDAHWEYGLCVKVREEGFEKDLAYYRDRLAVIVPNIRRLQDAFRSAGMEVIHTRIQSMTADGRDRGPSHTDAADLGFHVVLVEDGCAAIVPEMHWGSIRILRDVYAKIMTTEEVIGRITALK